MASPAFRFLGRDGLLRRSLTRHHDGDGGDCPAGGGGRGTGGALPASADGCRPHMTQWRASRFALG